MAEAYVGEIRMFGGDYAPVNWAMCDGQLVSIQDNEILYCLLSTYYGGDGQNTFGIPDMRGRLPMHAGRGVGLTWKGLGMKGGVESVSLVESQIPSHTHNLKASTATGNSVTAAGKVPAKPAVNAYAPASGDTTQQVELHPETIEGTGAGYPHANHMPYQCVSFIIALQGHFPPRTSY